MDQRRLELRISYLRNLIAGMEAKRSGLSEVAQIRRLEDNILGLQGGIKELKQWAKEIDEDPGYGKLVRDPDGFRRPKLPVFESRQEREAVLANRAGAGPGLSESDVRRAREFRVREDAEIAAKGMDGRSPYIPEEERGASRGTL